MQYKMRGFYYSHYNRFFKPLQKRCFQSNAPFIKISDEVASALLNQQPVVALESTIISHGLPYPSNLNTALSVENTVRKFGATPATIGIINGELLVGLSSEELKHLATTKNTIKTSRRDLSYVISNRLDGGTTVSATMLAAELAGIDVFVTGGIGGVHRGAQESFDISADLLELSRTPVAVICAGVKSILDIGLTLEYLETQGVPVISFGKSKCFPAFFSPTSTYDAPYNSESVTEIAQIINNQKLMNMKNGLVLGVPIPVEDGKNFDEMEKVIEDALREAKLLGVKGKKITPFVLEKVVELSEGDSLTSNIKLIENNARIGAKISCELSKLKSENQNKRIHLNSNSKKKSEKRGRPIVIGGSIFDIKATVDSISEIPEETNLGKLHTSFGGVGRNIAECLRRMGEDPLLISSVGRDQQGEMMLTNMGKLGMDTSGIFLSDLPTASYSIVADRSGELIMAVGDMDTHDSVTSEKLNNFKEDIKDAGIVVLDGNISSSTLQAALKLCAQYDIPTWFDPTTVGKSVRPFLHKDVNMTYISPNIEELRAINGILKHTENISLNGKTVIKDEIIKDCLHLSPNLFCNVENLIITLGKKGVLVVSKRSFDTIFSAERHQSSDNYCVIHYPPASESFLPVPVKSVSGAGDSFASGVIYGYLNGYDTDTCIKGGLLAAYKSLNTYVAISSEITPELMLYDSIHEWASFKGNFLL